MRSRDYGADALAGGFRRGQRPPAPVVEAVPGLVVEDAGTDGFCGAVVACEKTTVTLEDRFGRQRVFPLAPGAFLFEGKRVTLVRPAVRPDVARVPSRTASGSIAAPAGPARVARASRIYVEGLHDAALVEQIWGDDLREVGVVVECLDGIDHLADVVSAFGPGPGRRLGVLVDHLVPGSKESRIAAAMTSPHVLVAGHPFVDVWQAIRPAALGIRAWPVVPRGLPWKEGIMAGLGWGTDTAAGWRRILAAAKSYADLEPALLGRVEELIDFVTEPA